MRRFPDYFDTESGGGGGGDGGVEEQEEGQEAKEREKRGAPQGHPAFRECEIMG